jgi:hypothetical protein
MKNIHVLPTEKPSRLAKSTKSGLNAAKKGKGLYESGRFGITTFNIYITSDEEIKEGDSIYDASEMSVVKCPQMLSRPNYFTQFCKKIILSTDQDLIADGVQAIDDEFLEWFVKNPSCEKVEVEKTQYNPVFDEDDLSYDGMTTYYSYKIIIQKEEPKQETTLEEFIESQPYYGTCTYEYKEGIEVGAKWQQERSYSEEEVLAIIFQKRMPYMTDTEIIEWFEQFKKK